MKKVFKLTTNIFGMAVWAVVLVMAYIGVGAAVGWETEDEMEALVNMVSNGWGCFKKK